MDWYTTFKLIGIFILAITSVGSIAIGLAWLWEWCTPSEFDHDSVQLREDEGTE